MLHSRSLFGLLILLLATSGGFASGPALQGTVAAVQSGRLPDSCVAVQFTAPEGLRLYRRDVCTVVRQGQKLGKAVVLLSGDHVAVLYVLFAGPIRKGDGFVVAQRQGFVQEDAYLTRLAAMNVKAQDDGKKSQGDRPWNGLQYRSRTDDATNLLHFWAATVQGSTLSGVDDNGYWHSLPLAARAIPVLSWEGELQDVSQLGDGAEMDAVVGTSGGKGRVVALVVRPPIAVGMLLRRLAPRMPVTFDAPLPLVEQKRQDVLPTCLVRQLRQCRVESLDLVNSRVTLRSFTGEILRARLAQPVIDVETCGEIDPRSLMGRAPMDVVCYHGKGESAVLAVGAAGVLPEASPRLVGKVTGPADSVSGGNYYAVSLSRRDGVRPRDVVAIWRAGVRLGQGMLMGNEARSLVFIRAGAPPLRAGDVLTFVRRARTAYIDADRFTDSRASGTVRRTTDPREAFVLDAYEKDKEPSTPDMYHGGPFQTGAPPTRANTVAVAAGEGRDGLLSMGEIVVLGYHETVGEIKESKLSIEVQPAIPDHPALVHFRFQFHAPFDWGDPLGVLETNVTLNREEFKTLLVAWNKAVEVWRYSPKEMLSKGYHGIARDSSRPEERFVELLSAGKGPTKSLVMAFTDPRPIFSKKKLTVKRIDAILPESAVNNISGIFERVKSQLGW